MPFPDSPILAAGLHVFILSRDILPEQLQEHESARHDTDPGCKDQERMMPTTLSAHAVIGLHKWY